MTTSRLWFYCVVASFTAGWVGSAVADDLDLPWYAHLLIVVAAVAVLGFAAYRFGSAVGRPLVAVYRASLVLFWWPVLYAADRVQGVRSGLTVRDLLDGLRWAVDRDG